ncbi:ATP-binding Cassette (ABC) Superfamily [Trachipleistophora hominis]|uniref:ATP-binding Cassette (ABC) Superfamily n=1 Tax=Trachipleistophora hominis TaxID=72359 RepID=L7JZU2_TRAHO|nr:ATP-binding Cassette (ABC) Superfamily [Trachipleistophora hominis]
MLIELKDVSIRVKNRSEKGKKVGEHILSNVCGEIRAGFTAVIGPSGCGKTTLLRTILGKVPSEYISSGEISYCGRKRVLDEWTRMTTYLDQCESVSAFLTAKECLYYAAVFSSKYTKSVIYEKIEEIAKKLSLKNVLNCAMVNLSGGQVKRVQIALELIIDMPIILLDEPTTGVDNVLAYRIIEFLKEIAGYNKIVVCSIHQPDDRTLMLFDRVILMNWGRIVYNGTVGNIARTIAENGFLNIDNLEISTYVLDFLNTGRVKYVDPSEHCQIVDNMVSKYLLTCRKHKRKYVEKKSNEFYLRFAPCFNHIIMLCKRDLKITFKPLRLQIFILILYNLLFLALPFVPLSLYKGNTSETVLNTEKQILNLEKELTNHIQSSLCFCLSNVALYINQYKNQTVFLAVKEINRHAYTITSYYIGTMLLSITYFLPVFILDLVLFRVLSRDLFDNMSLVLITLFFFSTIFF